jgi:hypothetical protein
MLGPGESDVVNRVSALLVPGPGAVRPDRYLASTLRALSRAEEDAVRAAIGTLASVTDEYSLARLAGSAAFELVRRLAIGAFYGNTPGPEPQALRDRADVIVVGGGEVAADLAARGVDVLVLADRPVVRLSTSDERATGTSAGYDVLLDGNRVTGIADSQAPVVVLAAGALSTVQILLRMFENAGLDTPSSRLVGRSVGLRPVRHVYGLFDEPQHRVPDPKSFAESLVDANDHPLWGHRLANAMRQHCHWAGVHMAVADDNTARIDLGVEGEVVVTKSFSPHERRRLDEVLARVSVC